MPKAKAKFDNRLFSDIFILVILIGILYFCYLLFKPFITEIIIAGVLVAIFYPAFLKIVYWTRGRLYLSSFIICFLILLVIIVPFTYFIFYLAQQVLNLYGNYSSGLIQAILNFSDAQIWNNLNLFNKEVFNFQEFIIDSISQSQRYIIPGASSILRSASEFFVSLVIVFITMFFLFLDGRALLKRVMQLTPLSNKYDKLIWMKFRDVSYSSIVATFITSFVQAVTAMIAFFIVGIPVFIAGVLIFLFSFVPYIGTAFVWLPIGLYLLIVGEVWQGIFILLWGGIIISLVDNFLRPYLIKNKAKVHPMIIFFSIFGGLVLFGIWGVVFGPLIVSLALTLLHIYELEYSRVLERY